MFDNPKKELEWLEQQLLAAEDDEVEEDAIASLCDDIYDEFDAEESYEIDDELFSRAAGFDAEEVEYYMDSDRYVPAPKKKSIWGLVIFAITLPLAIIALVLWYLWRLL